MAQWRRYASAIADEDRARGAQIVGNSYGINMMTRMAEGGATPENESALRNTDAMAREYAAKLAGVEPPLLRSAVDASDDVVKECLR